MKPGEPVIRMVLLLRLSDVFIIDPFPDVSRKPNFFELLTEDSIESGFEGYLVSVPRSCVLFPLKYLQFVRKRDRHLMDCIFLPTCHFHCASRSDI